MQQIKGWLQSFLSLLIISVHLTDSSGWHDSTSWCQSCLWWFFSANLCMSLPTLSAIWPRNDVCLSANMHWSIICMSHKARWKSVSNQFSPLSDSGSAKLLAAGCFCSTIADFSAVPTERPEEDGSLSPQNTGFAINISQHLRTNHIVLSFLRSLRRYSLFLFFFTANGFDDLAQSTKWFTQILFTQMVKWLHFIPVSPEKSHNGRRLSQQWLTITFANNNSDSQGKAGIMIALFNFSIRVKINSICETHCFCFNFCPDQVLIFFPEMLSNVIK